MTGDETTLTDAHPGPAPADQFFPLDASALRGPPTIENERLLLRPMTMDDLDAVCEMCADVEIARGTISIPHPYSRQAGEDFLRRAARGLEKETFYVWGIQRKSDGLLVGDIGLEVDLKNRSAEAGFIVGKRHWGAGYATEALRASIHWGFCTLCLQRIFGACMTWNTASERVMRKAGMVAEGVLRQSILKWGRFEDSLILSIIRSEWEDRPHG